ncbi:MAG: ATP-binding protein [bacterium]|nr:ATP-binding protein [bacterium]
MSEKTKTPDHLIRELEDARRRIAELEAGVTEHKRVGEAVQESQARLEGMLDIADDAIISMDADQRITLFNKGAERIFGYTVEETLGQPLDILLPERFVKSHREHVQDFAALPVPSPAMSERGILFGRRKDGEEFPVEISILKLEIGGETAFTAILRDIKRAEEQLIRSEKLAAVGRMTAGVAHEILNPLNIITLGLHMMADDPDTPPEFVDQVRVLEGQAIRIAKISQGLLSYARQRPVERRRFDFNETVRRTLDLVSHELRLRAVEVELRLAEGLPPILADEDQIQQVILNLLTNAHDAMPEGGRLVLHTEAVRDDGRQFVELRVEDTGEGIDPDHLGKLFDPFFTTKHEGTGLGLSICQGIIEAHGGAIRAENLPEGGTSFIIRLGIGEE